jgi:hypothetical protein
LPIALTDIIDAMGASPVGTLRCDLTFLVRGNLCSQAEILDGKRGGRAQTVPKETHSIKEKGEQRGEELQEGVAQG